MSDILVVFGSKSDSNVFEEVKKKIDCELRICSAHRTPDMLDDILKKTKAKVIIAGAGLAAHLPGVIASKTLKPIIGVPVESNFNGLDSFLSIVQMPPGIPVLSVGVDKGKEAAEYAEFLLKEYDGVNIVGEIETKAVKKAVGILDKFSINTSFSNGFDERSINLNFVKLGEKAENKFLTINIPVKENNNSEDSIKLLKAANKGLWVGLNRGDNAALAAVSILGRHKELGAYRREMAEKVKEDDRSYR